MMRVGHNLYKRGHVWTGDRSPKRKRGVWAPVARAPGSDERSVFAECLGWPSPTTDVVRSARGGNPAFSLAETLVSILLVSGLLVVALNTVGAARLGQQKMGDRGRGQLLAQDLMAEILQQVYEEPVDTPVFGREATESAVSRAAYDDVDDYHGWDASPPEYKNGTDIPGPSGWRRSVTVEYVDPDDLTGTATGDLGVKRITITVKHDDLVAASMVAVRTGAADTFAPERGVEPAE